jgi:hypothetical protein
MLAAKGCVASQAMMPLTRLKLGQLAVCRSPFTDTYRGSWGSRMRLPKNITGAAVEGCRLCVKAKTSKPRGCRLPTSCCAPPAVAAPSRVPGQCGNASGRLQRRMERVVGRGGQSGGSHALLRPKMCVAVGGQYLNYAIVDGESRHIKGAPSQVKHQNVLSRGCVPNVCVSVCWACTSSAAFARDAINLQTLACPSCT